MVKEGKSTKTKTKAEEKDLETELQHRLEQDRLHQRREPESSYITSSSASSETFDSFVTHLEASAEDEINIFDLLQQTDTESLEDEELEEPQLDPISSGLEPDFFQLFGEVPNVNDISEDISVATIPIDQTVVLELDARTDAGKFVNPLTGLELIKGGESVSTKSDNKEELVSASISGTEDSNKDEDFSDASELILPDETLDQDRETKADLIDDTLHAFFELEKEAEIVESEEIDWEALEREKESKVFQKHTLLFLTELIDKVVEHSEHMSPNKFLQKNLDKRKLIAELSVVLPSLQSINNTCAFLNRQVVQHFRRKKSFRNIMEDNPNTLSQDKEKLQRAKEHLDQTLVKEKELIQKSTDLQEELTVQYRKLKQQAASRIYTFETLVKKHLYREGSPKLNSGIERLLMSMSKYRSEISEVRLSLFLQQHTVAKLTEQIKQMEGLGNGVNIKSFDTFQAENQTLEKKIEERNADLTKLYRRCHNNIHTMMHYKEKQTMVQESIETQRAILDKLIDDKRFLRDNLLSLKLQRNRMNNKIKTLGLQGGLLAKPALMFDYDNTVNVFGEKREKVKLLRKTLLLIQKKIDKLFEQCQKEKN